MDVRKFKHTKACRKDGNRCPVVWTPCRLLDTTTYCNFFISFPYWWNCHVCPFMIWTMDPAATQLLLVQCDSATQYLFNFKWNLLEIMGYSDDTWPRKLHGGYPAKNLYLQWIEFMCNMFFFYFQSSSFQGLSIVSTTLKKVIGLKEMEIPHVLRCTKIC